MRLSRNRGRAEAGEGRRVARLERAQHLPPTVQGRRAQWKKSRMQREGGGGGGRDEGRPRMAASISNR